MNTLTTPQNNLTAQQAMVLMEIEEMIEDDAVHLGRELNMSIGRVAQIINDLQKKGLVVIQRASGELYVRLSRKGRQFYETLWLMPATRSNSH